MPPRPRCPCRGETLDRLLQPAILTLLARQAISGYRLRQLLARTPILGGSQPDAAGLYRTVRQMERRGLLRGAWRISARGPARRILRLTPAGRRCLSSWSRTLTAYLRSVQALLALLSRAQRRRGSSRPAQGASSPP
jgi:DNA-binding PadR family transcriptional regulator